MNFWTLLAVEAVLFPAAFLGFAVHFRRASRKPFTASRFTARRKRWIQRRINDRWKDRVAALPHLAATEDLRHRPELSAKLPPTPSE